MALRIWRKELFRTALKTATVLVFHFGVYFASNVVAAAGIPSITYGVAIESDAGMDGGIAWQSVFLLNDGRIASFGTGNHAHEQSNAMRIIDPVGTPGSVTSYDLFPWTQASSPPSWTSGSNQYVTNYDNHASIYIPSENKALWINHGVFDFAARSWTYGDRAPLTLGYRDFLDDSAGSMSGVYNPATAWCSQLDKGVWFGNSAGGYGRQFDDLTIIERNTQSGAVKPWRMTVTSMGSQSVAGLHYSRNTAVCIGEYLYVGGPKQDGSGNAFYKIHVPTKTLTATLTPYPEVAGEYFPQMVYDAARARIVVVGVRVLEYDIGANAWTDVTPAGWVGYESVMGVYHPTRNAIYFRGIPKNSSSTVEMFKWHRMSFSSSSSPPAQGDTQPPSIPQSLGAAVVSSTQVAISWGASNDNVAVVGYKIYRNGAQIATPAANNYVDSGLAAATNYSYTVAAFDAAGNQSAMSAPTTILTPVAPPPVTAPSTSAYREIMIDSAANPFLGPPDRSYGGSKHVWWVWHPIMKRVYTWGGDYGNGAESFGQPSMGASFTAGSGRTYQRDSSLNNDQYSLDPYATGSNRWRLEHPYLPRNLGGARETRPGRPDQVSLVWDSRRNKFWGFITTLRTEFLYRLADGTPDLWANGDMTTTDPVEPTGTWSFAPGATGGAGTWTLETAARLAYRSGVATQYSGNVLITGSGDERVANWEFDATTDRVVSFGFGRIFIFDPNTKTYEHRVFSPGAYGYFNPCSSYVAIVNDWMYGVAMVRQNGVQKSLLIRVNIPKMLALANGAAIPDSATYWEPIQLPWSLSEGSVWERNNDSYAKWQEHAGVVTVAGKVVVIASYGGLVDNGVTKMAAWDPATRVFSNASAPPDSAIAANSWVALPDSGEVLFGLNTSGYTNGKLWAYKVGSPSPPPAQVAAPAPPSNVQLR